MVLATASHLGSTHTPHPITHTPNHSSPPHTPHTDGARKEKSIASLPCSHYHLSAPPTPRTPGLARQGAARGAIIHAERGAILHRTTHTPPSHLQGRQYDVLWSLQNCPKPTPHLLSHFGKTDGDTRTASVDQPCTHGGGAAIPPGNVHAELTALYSNCESRALASAIVPRLR
jgi:hypothetical protein